MNDFKYQAPEPAKIRTPAGDRGREDTLSWIVFPSTQPRFLAVEWSASSNRSCHHRFQNIETFFEYLVFDCQGGKETDDIAANTAFEKDESPLICDGTDRRRLRIPSRAWRRDLLALHRSDPDRLLSTRRAAWRKSRRYGWRGRPSLHPQSHP